MRWIGQHIWDFISRFRNDVYLENISDHGSDPDRFLTMDSTTGRVSYRTGSEVLSDIGASSEATDLEFSGATANGVLTYGGAAQIDVESTLTYSSDTINIGAADDDNSYIKKVQGSSSDGGDLYVMAGYAHGSDNSGGNLWLSAGSSTGSADGGSIKFISTVAGSGGGSEAVNTPVEIAALDKSGNLQIDGGLTTGSTSFVNSSGVIQVATQGTIDHDSLANSGGNKHIDWTGASAGTIHSSNIPTLNQNTTGNAATAGVAKNIDGATDGDVTITSDGEVIVKLDSDNDESNQRFKITDNSDAVVFYVQEDGTVMLAGDVITNSSTDNDLTLETDGSLTFTIDRDNDETSQKFSFVNFSTEVASISETGSLILGDTDGTAVYITTPAHDNGNGSHFDISAGGATAGQTDKAGGTLALYSGQGTGTGSNEIRFYTYPAAGSTGTSLNSAVKAVTITNDGNLRVDGNVITNNISATNFSVLSSRILELQHAGSYNIQMGNSTNPDVLKVEGDAQAVTVNGDLTVNGDSVTFESANADDPIFTLKNTNNDTNDPAQMIFIKDRGAAPTVGTNLGEVRFQGEDSNQNSQEYGGFLCEIDVATDGQESGQFGIWVATHDGELQYGLQLTGGSEEDEVDVAIGQGSNSLTSIAGNLDVTGIITGKQREVFFQNFFDDLGTTKHYLPFKSQSEQTSIYQEEAAVVMPCDGRIVSITLRVNFPNADGNITMGVHTRPVNTNVFTTGDWVEEETETMALQNADDSHVFHFAFDNAKHFESSELVSISMQCDSDISGNAYWYVSTVVEYDWSTFLGTTSAEIESTP